MIMQLTTGYWNNQSERKNMKVDEENCKSVVMVNGRYWKRWQFSSSYLWSWGVEAVGEGRRTKYNWKEEEDKLNKYEG